MDVIIDGQRDFEMRGTPQDILGVMEAINGFCREKRRAVLRVVMDGADLSINDQMRELLEGRPASSVQSIEVFTEDLTAMADASLSRLESNLPELPAACRSLAELFHSDTPSDGYAHFESLAQIWGFIKDEQILLAKTLDINLSELDINGISLETMHEELNQFLREAMEAMEAGDCVLLGDLLEYELAPRAEQETDIVALLRKRISG